MIRRPPRSTHCISSAASDVYKRQVHGRQKQLKKLDLLVNNSLSSNNNNSNQNSYVINPQYTTQTEKQNKDIIKLMSQTTYDFNYSPERNQAQNQNICQLQPCWNKQKELYSSFTINCNGQPSRGCPRIETSTKQPKKKYLQARFAPAYEEIKRY
eukprot:TRINITY_DN33203_c0_g1_i1.p1 TRINITY_DN33203_c0_g1~~TRINITY_DN33203_c0_g1_i1.p1  ORF type:complete len:155 (+),score=38.00 TRINITY_DN33203_c0_g1_i1:100-564(+)